MFNLKIPMKTFVKCSSPPTAPRERVVYTSVVVVKSGFIPVKLTPSMEENRNLALSSDIMQPVSDTDEFQL